MERKRAAAAGGGGGGGGGVQRFGTGITSGCVWVGVSEGGALTKHQTIRGLIRFYGIRREFDSPEFIAALAISLRVTLLDQYQLLAAAEAVFS